VGFYSLVIGLVPDMVQRARRTVRKVIGLRGHLVIAGWNTGARSTVEHLLTVQPQDQRRIYVLGDGDPPGEVEDLGLQFIQGAPGDPATAKRASIARADAVFVPPGRGEPGANAPLDGLALFLASHLASAAPQGKASHLVACTTSAETGRLLARMGALVAETPQTGGCMLSQALLKPGVELVLQQMLAARRNQIVIEKVHRRWRRHTFHELAQACPDAAVTPLGLVLEGNARLVPDAGLRNRPLAESEGVVFLTRGPVLVGRPPRDSRPATPDSRRLDDEKPAIQPGDEVLLVGCNSHLDALISHLRAAGAQAHVLVADDRTADRLPPSVAPQLVHIAPPGSADRLREQLARDAMEGVLILADPLPGEEGPPPGQEAGQVLLRIRELEAQTGLAPAPVVIETATASDHPRLRYVNSLFATTGAPIPRLHLVCVQGMCGALMAMAVRAPRVVKMVQGLLDPSEGCELSIARATEEWVGSTFADVAAWAVGIPDSAPSIPIAVLRDSDAYLRPPAAFGLENGDRIVCIRRTGLPPAG
jgi:hypothetical protein